jgi:hypothetical protein
MTEVTYVPLTPHTEFVGIVGPDGKVADFSDISSGISRSDTRLDYEAREDSQPVYIGRADGGTLTSAGTWVIERLTYDETDRPILKQTRTGAWDNRATLDW